MIRPLVMLKKRSCVIVGPLASPQYLPLKGGEPAPDLIRGRRPPTWSGGAGWGSTRGRNDQPMGAPGRRPPPDPLQGEVWSFCLAAEPCAMWKSAARPEYISPARAVSARHCSLQPVSATGGAVLSPADHLVDLEQILRIVFALSIAPNRRRPMSSADDRPRDNSTCSAAA